MSSISDTRVLALGTDEEAGIEELEELGSFNLSAATIHAVCYNSRSYQVTSFGVVSDAGEWRAPASQKITLATSHQQYLLLAASGGDLYLLDLSQASPVQVAHAQLEEEVACLDLSPVHDGKSLAAAVGLWNTYSVVVLDAPTLSQAESIEIGTKFLPRSVVTVSMSDSHGTTSSFLLIGLGDGSLVSYAYQKSGKPGARLDNSTRKAVTLGSRPITLAKFQTAGNQEAGVPSTQAVLAISDRSTVISLAGSKLAYSSVNTKVSPAIPIICLY